MKKVFFLVFLGFIHLLFCSVKPLPGLEGFEKKNLSNLYKSLDQKSVTELFAFYNLYPKTEFGKKALKNAWNLLSHQSIDQNISLPSLDISLLINLVNNQNSKISDDLTQENMFFFETLGDILQNRNLKGHGIWKVEDMIALPIEEFDLSRALLLEEFGEEEDSIYKIKYFEICLDLMALQVLGSMPSNPTSLDKVNAINNFIFYEKNFRFPPQSSYSKNIDSFTFLSSVIDLRRGVCLGVSILYLSLAQRLGLNLEIITPPGHIYVRYKDENGKITNIETTARGVNLPSDVYLGIETKKLEQRNIKQVVGFAFINQASLFWGSGEYEKAVSFYKKAEKYLPNDPHLENLLAWNLLFTNKITQGNQILEKLKNYKSEYLTSKDSTIEDYLNKKTDIESLKAVFSPIEGNRASIIEKQNSLKKIISKFPEFRSALFQLSNTYLQLGREKEALVYLKKIYEIDSGDPTVNYYLSVLSYERLDYKSAWKYLKNSIKILKKENHYPKALKSFKEALKRVSLEVS